MEICHHCYRDTTAVSSYAYRPAPEQLIARARQIELACARHNVPLGAAALQFTLRDPRIISKIAGISRPERIEQTLALARHPIPEELWAELEALAPQGGPMRDPWNW